MRRKKFSEDDVKITHNNIMLDMDTDLINYIKARQIEELDRRKKEEEKTDKIKESDFDVITAMNDMRARVIAGTVENFLSKIIPKRFRKKQEIGTNIHEMDKRE